MVEINRAFGRIERAEAELNAAVNALIDLTDMCEDELGDMLQAVSDTLADVSNTIDDIDD